jgi:hypothetical protein
MLCYRTRGRFNDLAELTFKVLLRNRPRLSSNKLRNADEHETHHILQRIGARQVQSDLGFHFVRTLRLW